MRTICDLRDESVIAGKDLVVVSEPSRDEMLLFYIYSPGARSGMWDSVVEIKKDLVLLSERDVSVDGLRAIRVLTRKRCFGDSLRAVFAKLSVGGKRFLSFSTACFM